MTPYNLKHVVRSWSVKLSGISKYARHVMGHSIKLKGPSFSSYFWHKIYLPSDCHVTNVLRMLMKMDTSQILTQCLLTLPGEWDVYSLLKIAHSSNSFIFDVSSQHSLCDSATHQHLRLPVNFQFVHYFPQSCRMQSKQCGSSVIYASCCVLY